MKIVLKIVNNKIKISHTHLTQDMLWETLLGEKLN